MEKKPEYSEWEQNVIDEAPKYLRKQIKYDSAADKKAMELYGAPFGSLAGWQQKKVDDALADEKIYEPSYKFADRQAGIDDYVEWAMSQPAGADTSVEAYIAWDRQNYLGKSKENFYDSMIDVGDPQTLWEQIEDLRNKHDHTRRK
jgi:hypothetical protein